MTKTQMFHVGDAVILNFRQKLYSGVMMPDSTRNFLEELPIDLDGTQSVIETVQKCPVTEEIRNQGCDGYRYYIVDYADYFMSDEILPVNTIVEEDFEDVETLL